LQHLHIPGILMNEGITLYLSGSRWNLLDT